jgi:hypothetical protein
MICPIPKLTARVSRRAFAFIRCGIRLVGKFRFRNRPETLMPSQPSQYGCMRAPIIAVATAACLTALCVSGCGQQSQTCAVADYGGGGTSGYQTPQRALQSVLAQHVQWLSAAGWKMTERSTHAASFTSGNDSVDVVRNKAGKWNVGGVTACR